MQALLEVEGTAPFLSALKIRRDLFEDWLDLRSKLRTFYKGQQLALFKATQRDLRELEPDLPRVTDSVLWARIKKAQDVLQLDDPTKEIPSLAGLLSPVRDHIAALLAATRGKIEALWQAEVKHLSSVAQELGSEEEGALIRPFLALQGDLERATTLDAAEATQLRVQQTSKDVEQAILARINELAVSSTPHTPASSANPAPSTPSPRRIRTVTARQAMAPHQSYLETQQDLEDFLSRLRSELESALRQGERVRIE